MKLGLKKLISALIFILPLLLVLSVSFFITTSSLNKITTNYCNMIQIDSKKEYLNTKKAETKELSEELVLLLESNNKKIEPLIKKELQKEVAFAYNVAYRIYEKYKKKKSKKEIQEKIKDALSEIYNKSKDESIFISTYNADTILCSSATKEETRGLYEDADHRNIVLEEIQKVRKHGEGFIESRRQGSGKKEIRFVKDLGLYSWYLGSKTLVFQKQQQVKRDLLEMIKSIPIIKSDFLEVYENGKKLYCSNEKCHKHHLKDYYYITKEYVPFNWKVVYGFNTKIINAKAKITYKKLEVMYEEEYDSVLKLSFCMILFLVLISLFFSLLIFKKFQKEV